MVSSVEAVWGKFVDWVRRRPFSCQLRELARKRFTKRASSVWAYMNSEYRPGFSMPEPTQHQKAFSGTE